MIDCPGIVPPSKNATPEELLLRGVVRIENVENPEQYVAAALARCQKKHVERTYEITGWNNAHEFLDKLAHKGGRLLKGGEADLDGVGKMFLNDCLRGKVPWFVPPPMLVGADVNAVEGRKGKLGEMSRKRKLGEQDDNDQPSQDGEEAEFEGFGDENDDDDDDDDVDNDIDDVDSGDLDQKQGKEGPRGFASDGEGSNEEDSGGVKLGAAG